jgi:uncharacterized SAM-binding protein YcdF (DUF218 family)
MVVRMRSLILLLGIAVATWLVGLILFVNAVGAIPEAADDRSTDAIVVLTGGSERVSAGIDLLKRGHAKKLLISGVHPGLTLDQVLGNQVVSKDVRECCVILGHAAESTFGNADETLAWMDIEKYHSLRLVTSNYHMPRSLMIFHAILPQMEILPHPVAPDSVKLDDWWGRPGTASLLVTEYDKYLWAALRLWLRQT